MRKSLIGALLLLAAPLLAQTPIPNGSRVLFIGNSLTGLSRGGLPAYTNAAFAQGNTGIEMKWHRMQIWAESLKTHWNNTGSATDECTATNTGIYAGKAKNQMHARMLIEGGHPDGNKWDYVVLQDYAGDGDVNTISGSTLTGDFFVFAKNFVDLVRSKGGTPILYMRAPNNPAIVDLNFYKTQVANIIKNYNDLGAHLNVTVVPVAKVVDNLSMNPPSGQTSGWLYSDNIHPSDEGLGVQMYTFASILAKKSYKDITVGYGKYGGDQYTVIDPALDLAIRNGVYDVVQSLIGGGSTNSKPTFTTQPTGATKTVGESFSFTVDATGTPAPTFQWYKGSTAITGATSKTLSFASLTTADAGSYSCVANNTAGSTTSNTASLTVNTVPTGGTPVVIDSSDTTKFSYAGAWWSTNVSGAQDGSAYSANSVATNVATLTPGLSGEYNIEVFVGTPWSRASTSVSHVINHTGGATTATVNQAANLGTWVKLGTTSFTLSTTSTVVISGAVVQDADTSEERVLLDAFRFTPVTAPEEDGPYFEAEGYDATSSAAPWVSTSDSTASGGAYMVVPEGSTATKTGGAPTTGYLDYSFNLAAAGPVYVYIFTRETAASNNGSDSLYIDILNDGVAAHEWSSGFTINGTWQRWEWTTNKPTSLPAGNHTLRIHYREDGFQLDRIAISPTALP